MALHRIIISADDLRAVARGLRRSRTPYFTGHTSNSIFIPSTQTKFVDASQVMDWEGEMLLPGEIAKRCLADAFPGLRRVGWYGKQARWLGARWPMYCPGPYRGWLVYTDLVAAYLQIYQRLWLDVGYPCGYGSLDMAPVAYRLKNNKRARNAVMGLIRSTGITLVKEGGSKTVMTKNPYLSPGLWVTVQGVLQDIAQMGLDSGAIYCMIDGFFHPYNSDWAGFHRTLDQYGLSYRSKQGDGEIRGWGSYTMPRHKTTHNYERGIRGGLVKAVKPYAPGNKLLNFWRDSLDWRLRQYGRTA